MKITAVYPRWYEEHNLITRIIDDVSGEGGDGWGWIQTPDPDKWANALYNALLNIGWKQEAIEYSKKPNGIHVIIDQEGWFFTTVECDKVDWYDMVYRIEE